MAFEKAQSWSYERSFNIKSRKKKQKFFRKAFPGHFGAKLPISEQEWIFLKNWKIEKTDERLPWKTPNWQTDVQTDYYIFHFLAFL